MPDTDPASPCFIRSNKPCIKPIIRIQLGDPGSSLCFVRDDTEAPKLNSSHAGPRSGISLLCA